MISQVRSFIELEVIVCAFGAHYVAATFTALVAGTVGRHVREKFFTAKRKIGVYWRNPWVKGTTLLVVLIVVIPLEIWLTIRPAELDVRDPSQRITPAKARSKQEEVVIEGPILDSSRVLFSLKTSTEFINAHFEKAQLYGSTLTYFREKTPPAPANLETIDYTTESVEQVLQELKAKLISSGVGGRRSVLAAIAALPKSEQKGTCLTSVTAEFPDGSEMPKQIHFYLPQDSDSTRDLYLMVDAQLLVKIDISASIENQQMAFWIPGCVKRFQIGDWDRHLATSTGIEILTAPNTVLHFTFLPTPNSSWKNANDLYQPFVFVSKPLLAQTVRINRLSNDRPSTNPSSTSFSANIKKGARPLDLDHLVLNAEEVRLDFSGTALIKKHGEYVTENLYDRATKSRLLAGLLMAIHGAVILWVIGIFTRIFKPDSLTRRR